MVSVLWRAVCPAAKPAAKIPELFKNSRRVKEKNCLVIRPRGKKPVKRRGMRSEAACLRFELNYIKRRAENLLVRHTRRRVEDELIVGVTAEIKHLDN